MLRRATIDDINPLYDLLVALHDELRDELDTLGDTSGFLEIDPHKAYEGIQDCVLKSYVVIAEVDGKMAGSIGLGVRSEWFSETPHLWNCWTFVYPEYRNSRVALDMLRHVRDFAKTVNMPLVMGVSSFKDVDRKNRLFGRVFRPVGGWFIQGAEKQDG